MLFRALAALGALLMLAGCGSVPFCCAPAAKVIVAPASPVVAPPPPNASPRYAFGALVETRLP